MIFLSHSLLFHCFSWLLVFLNFFGVSLFFLIFLSFFILGFSWLVLGFFGLSWLPRVFFLFPWFSLVFSSPFLYRWYYPHTLIGWVVSHMRDPFPQLQEGTMPKLSHLADKMLHFKIKDVEARKEAHTSPGISGP